MRGRGGTPPGEEDKTFVGNLPLHLLQPVASHCKQPTHNSPLQMEGTKNIFMNEKITSKVQQMYTNRSLKLNYTLKNGVDTNLVKQH